MYFVGYLAFAARSGRRSIYASAGVSHADGEINAFFGGSQIMVAYATGGKPLGKDGFACIVAWGDKAGGRFVSNIVTIEVGDAGK